MTNQVEWYHDARVLAPTTMAAFSLVVSLYVWWRTGDQKKRERRNDVVKNLFEQRVSNPVSSGLSEIEKACLAIKASFNGEDLEKIKLKIEEQKPKIIDSKIDVLMALQRADNDKNFRANCQWHEDFEMAFDNKITPAVDGLSNPSNGRKALESASLKLWTACQELCSETRAKIDQETLRIINH